MEKKEIHAFLVMQRRKNIRLLIILIVLGLVNAGIIFFNNSHSGQNVDRYKFTLIDTSQVNRITLEQPDGEISFQKSDKGWQVDGKYKMDERMTGLIFAVMTSVETSRSAGTSANNQVTDRLLKEGVLVRFYSNDKVISAFHMGGNPTKTNSYMMKLSESIPYVVYIPGYSSYLAGLFELKVSDWRSKNAFETSWSSLKSLKLRSAGDDVPQLDIRYQGNFFKVANVSNADTVKMMNYLETTTALMVDQYIEAGEYSHYDSLITTQPQFTLSLEDVDATRNRQLQIFSRLGSKTQRLGRLLPAQQMVIIRQRKVDNILAVNSDFEQID